MNWNPVFWEQGVFLQPQHFQLEFLQGLHRTSQALALLCPWLWGLRRLEINETAVAAGVFEVSALELLLPSGEWAFLPGNSWLPPRSFEKAWTNPEIPLEVSLGLAELSDQGANAMKASDPQAMAEAVRYGAPLEPDSVQDYFGGGPAMEVSTLRYNLRLCFGDEERGALWTMPLARLVRDGERVRLDEKAVPPCVALSASPSLHRLVRDVQDTLLSRCRHLEDYKMVSTDGSWLSSSGSYEPLLFSILGLLSRYIPELNRCLTAPSCHPWEVYGLLCRLVGELSVFSRDLTPLGETRQGVKALPAYDHRDLYGCFSAAARIVMRIVDTLVMGPQFVFDLEPQEGTPGLFSAKLPQKALLGGSYDYWLLLRSSQVKELSEGASVLGKLAPTSDVQDLVTQALPGVRLRSSSRPPVGLPQRGDTVYFHVDLSDPLWQKAALDGELSYLLPGAPEDLMVQLSVIER